MPSVSPQDVWNALQPYLPLLLTEAAKETGKRVPAAVVALWRALTERMKQKPAARETLAELREAPDDEDLQAALRVHIRRLLRDEAFAAQLRPLVEQAGPRSIVTGPVESSVLNTGDGNQIQQVRGPVGGDVLGPGAQKTAVHYHDGAPATASRDLENAYLAWLIEQTNLLPLEGINPAAASRAEEQVRLHAVYTALLTMSPESHERLERGEADPREVRRRSVLEELNDHPRLVLLGDPGSGKSTFVNFVALCLAGERLGRPEANLQTLIAPLPDDDGDDREEWQPWDHGPLLPVRIVLRDFAARGLPETDEATAEHLWDFLEAELQPANLHAVVPHLRRVFAQEGGLFLFDGLDEVPEAEERRERIVRFIHQVALAYPRARVLVTSRTYAYRHQDWALEGFAVAVLAPFSRGQIIRFVDRWYAHIAQLRDMNADDARGRAQLLRRAILRNKRLYRLAERPLLLTLMASLHAWRGGSLPEKREQLYNDTVDLLLDWWERRRVVREKDGTVRLIQPSLAEYLNVGKDRLRKLLNQLAYEAHAAQPELRGTADIPEAHLVQGLLALTEEADTRPKRLVEYLRDRTGLLIPRGVGVYTFPHRTFQEYLAACHLTDTGYPDEVANLARQDPNRWREVCLLAGAKASRGGAFALWPLVDALCPDEPAAHPTEADLWGALLAGQALVENLGDGPPSEANRRKQARVRDWQVVILHSTLPAVERARAGDTLAALGDPRDGVIQVDKMLFAFVPEGPFLMGTRSSKDIYANECPQHMASFPSYFREAFLCSSDLSNECPQHMVSLPPFWISRYPVTNAQFAVFVAEGGYNQAELWPEAREAGVWRNGLIQTQNDEPRARPANFGFPFDLSNHPVVGITWYEALAFTRWLTHRWQAYGWLPKNWRVDLPSEAEWEKAARGGWEIPEEPFWSLPEGLRSQPSSLLIANLAPGRRYPWGNVFDPNLANTVATRLGTTTSVGVFPLGISPYGLFDLSGNVWEWTRSILKDYPYHPADGRELLVTSAPRVLRGGSFGNGFMDVRVTVRGKGYPDSSGLRYYGFRVVVVPESAVRGQRSAVRSG